MKHDDTETSQLSSKDISKPNIKKKNVKNILVNAHTIRCNIELRLKISEICY